MVTQNDRITQYHYYCSFQIYRLNAEIHSTTGVKYGKKVWSKLEQFQTLKKKSSLEMNAHSWVPHHMLAANCIISSLWFNLHAVYDVY